MKRKPLQLLSLESPFPEAHSMLRLLEPPQSCSTALWTQLFEGTYDKPFIVDTQRTRSLHFDLESVQSAMLLSDPDHLTLAYTRKMMAFLLFAPAPKRILLLGLGGGSLAKFCYRRLPEASITAVEVSPEVIALRDAFQIPPDDDRFRVIRADSADYVADAEPEKDVILADACDRNGVAAELTDLRFYRHARRRLAEDGVFVMNLCGDRTEFPAHLARMREVFGECATLPVRRDGNLIVFAFKGDFDARWGRLEARARALKRRFGLDFPSFLRRIEADWNVRCLQGS